MQTVEPEMMSHITGESTRIDPVKAVVTDSAKSETMIFF